MKLRITEAKLKEMDELMPLGKTDLGDLWDMRQDWVEMKKEVDRLSDRLDAEIKFHENTCIKYYAERSDLREENERLKSALKVIDIHIRSTHDPIPYITHDLKEVLYKEGTEE